MNFRTQNFLRTVAIPISLLIFNVGMAQEKDSKKYKVIGGPCDGCEAVYGYGNKRLKAIDTLPEFESNEPKIKITGTIYEKDGKTPAEGVILFIHQTDRKGVYPKRGGEKGWENAYGYLHGWIKTGKDGNYTFFTFKPGSYSDLPAHIHPIILEPNGDHYWLGSYHFSDDPLLTEKEKYPKSPRGGSNGLLVLKAKDGILVGKRDFILGKNVLNNE